MRFHFSPIARGVCVDVWMGGALVYIRGFPCVEAACHFTDNFDPDNKGVDGSWTA
jgi:hypothetical protein